MREEQVCRPGGFALTERLLRWYEEERAQSSAPRKGEADSPEDCVVLVDIGCGEGASLRYLRQRHPYWELLGVEPALMKEEILKDGMRILRGCGEHLPLENGSVDIVLMECSFSRLSDPDMALGEALRVLRPGGRLLISDLYVREGRGAAGPASAESEEGINCRIGRLESADEIRRRLEQHGFHLNRMKDVSKVLGQWIGQKIFDGDMGSVGEALGIEPCELRKLRCGYYLCEAVPSRLSDLLRYTAEHSAYGRDRIPDPEAGLCSERELLKALPLCDADDIRRDPYDFLCVPPREVARIITLKSSGSEGEPKRIFFTEADLDRTADFFDWGIRSLVRPGDRVAVFMAGPTHYSVGGLLKEGLSRLPAEVTVSGFISDYSLAAEQARGMDTLIGLPSQMYRLMKEYPELRPGTVLLSADNVPNAVIRRMEEIWGCRVFTHWGMSETGYGGGVQCTAREGYHLRDDDLLLEILDPKTGEPVPEGEYGEMVLTTLNRRAMPLIRYRTGDISRMVKGMCSCGSLLPRLDRVTGRLRGAIHLPDGGELKLPDVDEIVYEKSIRAYSASWDEREQRLMIRLLPENGRTRQENLAMEQEIRQEIGEHFGVSFAVTVNCEYEGEGTGKRRLTGEP